MYQGPKDFVNFCVQFQEDFLAAINMADIVGNVEERVAEKEIEWKITNFFSIAKTKISFKCPTFAFADASWHVLLIPKCPHKPGFMCYFICNIAHHKCSLEYDLGIKKLDGSIEHLSKGIMNNSWSSDSHYIELSKIQQRKSEFAPSNVLTITCILKRLTTQSDQPEMELPRVEKLINLDALSENFKNLYLNKESCDTTLLVMDQEYKAHRTVLMARSSVFAAMFLHETSEKQTGIVTIPDCDAESFEEFLQFLYSGKLEKPSPRTVLHLYETSEKYNVQDLKTFCSDFLIGNVTVEHFCDVVIMADKYDDTKLLSAAQCFFNKNLNNVFVTSEWDSLMKNSRRLANKLLLEMSSKVKVVE